jgi:hypothetical protein
MRLLLILLLLPLLAPAPISAFLNNRLIVRRSCQWSASKSQSHSNLLANFFSQRQGECLYALREAESELHLIVEMKDAEEGEMRELILNARLPLANQTRFRVSYGRQLFISFKDPSSLHLHAMA